MTTQIPQISPMNWISFILALTILLLILILSFPPQSKKAPKVWTNFIEKSMKW